MPDLASVRNTLEDHLRLILAVSRIGIWELDLGTGRAWRNLCHDEIFGYDALLPEWTLEDFLAHVVQEDRDAVRRSLDTAVADGQDWSFECRIRRADGIERWIAAHGRHVTTSCGAAKIVGHVMDITETRQREEHLILLNRELNHRLVNLVSVIQAMVRMSARQADDLDVFAASLVGRLEALLASYRLAAQQEGRAVRIADLIAVEADPYEDVRTRVRVEGDDDYMIEGKAAERLSLVLHELITNAVKYGALSCEDGQVRIRLEAAGDRVRVTWREEGGPPVSPPVRRGFGSRLLQDATETGQEDLDLQFHPDGLICRFYVPLTRPG